VVDAADGGDAAVGAAGVAVEFGADERLFLGAGELAAGGVEGGREFAFFGFCFALEEDGGDFGQAEFEADLAAVAPVDEWEVFADQDRDLDAVVGD
jgi:hypothetical protein